jgi:membrane-bound serine protease (ClpP class)
MKKISARLILAIVSTLLEEAALVAVVFWALPQVGIYIPLAGLFAMMVAWGVFSVFTYRKGTLALQRKPVVGLPAMIGCRGKVISPLAPDGVVKIKNELWEAKSGGRKINPGVEVTVLGQDGLRLIVRKSSADELECAK